MLFSHQSVLNRSALANVAMAMATFAVTAALNVVMAEPLSRAVSMSHLGLREGLSQAHVLSLAQDAQGYVWIGTEDGLNRFDGRTVENSRPSPDATDQPAPGGYIHALLATVDGNLWVGALRGGLTRRDARTGRFNGPSELASEQVYSLAQSRDGRVWAGMDGQGVVSVSNEGTSIQHWSPVTDAGKSDFYAAAIAFDTHGLLWIAGGRDVAVYDTSTRVRLQHWTLTSKGVAPTDWHLAASGDAGAWVAIKGQGLFWLPTSGGASRHWAHLAADRNSLPSDTIQSLTLDAEGNVWMGSDVGVIRFHGGAFDLLEHDPTNVNSLSENNISSLLIDRGGMLWIGTQHFGVDRWSTNSESLGAFRAPVFHLATPLAVERGATSEELLVGTDGKGLMTANLKNHTVLPTVGVGQWLKNSRVSALHKDRAGTLWVGTMAGELGIQKAGSNEIRKIPRPTGPGIADVSGVIGFHELPGGEFWVSLYEGGLCKIIQGINISYQCFAGMNDNRFSGHSVTEIVSAGQDGVYWVGTLEGGVYLYNERTKVVRAFQHRSNEPNSLSSDAISALYSDAKDSVWVATNGGGVDHLRLARPELGGETIEHFGREQGLPSNSVYAMEPGEEGELWLATGHGLAKLSRGNGQIQRFGEMQGAVSLDYNFGAHLRTDDGYLVFGGAGGFNRFQPASVNRPKFVSPPVLQNVEIKNVPIRGDTRPEFLRSVNLDHEDSIVSFDVSTLDFEQPNDVQYYYRLDGFDLAWINSAHRNRITYTNLSPGHYQLRVKAMSADGIETAESAPIHINVARPLWLKSQAFALYAALIGLLLAYLIRQSQLRNERRVAYARELELRVQERTNELEQSNLELKTATEARASFVARMSHELRTPMNGVIGLSDLLMGTKLDSTQRRFVKSIMTSAESLVDILTNILDFSRLESTSEMKGERVPFDIDALLEQTVDLFVGRAADKDLELIYASPGVAAPRLIGDPLRVRQVISNLIGNAVKFSLTGHVIVTLRLEPNSANSVAAVNISVTDSGVGIRPENLERIFGAFTQEDGSTTRRFGGSGLGLTIARQLTELMGGKLSVISEIDVGSTFSVSLTLPIEQEADVPREVGALRINRVYVVDPSAAVREVILGWLQAWKVPAIGCAQWAEMPEHSWHQVGGDDVLIVANDYWAESAGNPAEIWRQRDMIARPRVAVLRSFGSRMSTETDPLVGASLIKPVRWHELHHVLSSLTLGSSRFRSVVSTKNPATPVSALNVLVVDDQEINRTVGIGLLQSLGHRAAAVEGGAAAIEAARSMRYDVILMDCQMPGMDGFEATATIGGMFARDDQRPTIIAVTADTSEQSRKRCAEVGMDGFLAKPISRSSLARALGAHFEEVRL